MSLHNPLKRGSDALAEGQGQDRLLETPVSQWRATVRRLRGA